MKLEKEGWKGASAFIKVHGRPLERALFAYHFERGGSEDVFEALAEYQNPDGGFGRGLEPDLRIEDSSAIATTVGLQILCELKAKQDHPAVRAAVQYLVDTYDAEHQAWMHIPENVDDAPHAPWWVYDGDFEKVLANPRAEIVGYLVEYSSLVPGALVDSLVEAVMAHLQSMPDAMEMHELLCYLRFAETPGLQEEVRLRVLDKLRGAVETIVVREPSQWTTYGLNPLDVVTSPSSPFASMLETEVNANLDYELQNQGEDGSFSPSFSWGGAFPDAWERAKREWKGIFTLRTLLRLCAHDRIRFDFRRLPEQGTS